MRYMAPDLLTGHFAPLDAPQPKPDRIEARPFQFLDCDPDIRHRRLSGRWPTWETSSSYLYIEDLGDKAIGWEFLRRNPFYIADYHNWKHLHSQAHAGPRAETPTAWEDVNAASITISKEYGLHPERYPHSPSLDRPPLLEGEDPTGMADLLMAGESLDGPPISYQKAPSRGIFAVICIYPDRSEEAQVQSLRHHLAELRSLAGRASVKPTLRPHIQDIKRYLQILDAKAAWSSSQQIIRAAYRGSFGTPPSKRLSREYKRARELALTGYQAFFASGIHEITY